MLSHPHMSQAAGVVQHTMPKAEFVNSPVKRLKRQAVPLGLTIQVREVDVGLDKPRVQPDGGLVAGFRFFVMTLLDVNQCDVQV